MNWSDIAATVDIIVYKTWTTVCGRCQGIISKQELPDNWTPIRMPGTPYHRDCNPMFNW